MQLELHPLSQRQATGNSDSYIEPDFKVRSILVRITAISVNALGSVSFRLQHSPDGSDWTDVPSVTTGNLAATGRTTVSIDPELACFDHIRIAWTFTSANSVTFYGAILGTK